MTQREAVAAADRDEASDDGGQVWFHNETGRPVPRCGPAVPTQRGPVD